MKPDQPRDQADRWTMYVVLASAILFVFLCLGAALFSVARGAPPEIVPMAGSGASAIGSSSVSADTGGRLTDDATGPPVGRGGMAVSRSRRRVFSHPDPPVVDHQPPTRHERRLVHTALHHCEKASARRLDPFAALRLLRVEGDVGLPSHLAGLTLAAWCGENAYGTEGVGDGGRAVGPLQIHPGALWAWCGRPDRKDVTAAAFCWLRRVKHLAEGKALRKCGKRWAWTAAEVWVSRGGQRANYSCRLKSGHVVRYERWHRLGGRGD